MATLNLPSSSVLSVNWNTGKVNIARNPIARSAKARLLLVGITATKPAAGSAFTFSDSITGASATIHLISEGPATSGQVLIPTGWNATTAALFWSALVAAVAGAIPRITGAARFTPESGVYFAGLVLTAGTITGTDAANQLIVSAFPGGQTAYNATEYVALAMRRRRPVMMYPQGRMPHYYQGSEYGGIVRHNALTW
jgi:hypothetical protein